MLRELDIASTFLDLAAISSDPRHKQRARIHAQAAIQSVWKFLPKLQTERTQLAAIRKRLALLERRILEVGLLLPAALG